MGRTGINYGYMQKSQTSEDKISIASLRVNKSDGPLGFQRRYKVIVAERAINRSRN